MVVIFDLDDTLFDEWSYVLGGLTAAAKYLTQTFNAKADVILEGLIQEAKRDRSEVFDRFLMCRGIISPTLVKRCVSVYRGHTPQISLYPEAKDCLTRLHEHHHPLYVVTDGNKIVQKKKFEALGLDAWIKQCLYTNAYGLKQCKPSPYCFQKICDFEKTSPSNVVYVADNPNKDFVGINPLGFHTIRVMTGRFKELEFGGKFEAEMRISSLNELDSALLEKNFSQKNKRKGTTGLQTITAKCAK